MLREYAANRSDVALWEGTAAQLHEAVVAVCFAQMSRRRKNRRVAVRVTEAALAEYEKTHSASLLHSELEQGVSVPDIARAVAGLLGDRWEAFPGEWGVRAYVAIPATDDGYMISVTENGSLYVEPYASGNRTVLSNLHHVDGIGTIAHSVADTVRALHKDV
ncbi:MAG TPA: hypothetical protein VIU15_27815 [Streptomyces sp.]